METIYKKCLYCDKMTHDPHFVSRCCGRGMCEDCFNRLEGTMEQFQIDYMEDEDYQKYVEGVEYPFEGDYICFDHAKTK